MCIRDRRYDCGSKLGYLQATVEYALEHPELRQDFERYLHGLMAERLSPAQRKAGLKTVGSSQGVTISP